MISVIVPVYNTEGFLLRCVKSIQQQEYENLEILLIDDGSTDASGIVCDSLEKEDSRIRVLHQRNAGVSAARNAGVALAKGEFLTFADSDDYMDHRMISQLYQIHEEQDADISSCTYAMEKKNVASKLNCTLFTFDKKEAITDMINCENITYSSCCKLFKKSTVSDILFCEEISHNEDLLYCYQAILRSNKVAHTTESLYVYCNNSQSATRIKFNHSRMTAIDVQDWILEDIQKRFPDTALLKSAEQQYLKVNIYTAMQMARAGYQDKSDQERVRENVRRRVWKLIFGNLAIGYKIHGLLLVVNQGVFYRYITGKARKCKSKNQEPTNSC